MLGGKKKQRSVVECVGSRVSCGGGCFLSTHWATGTSLTLAHCEPFIFAASCAAARIFLLIRNIVQSASRQQGLAIKGIAGLLNREDEKKAETQ